MVLVVAVWQGLEEVASSRTIEIPEIPQRYNISNEGILLCEHRQIWCNLGPRDFLRRMLASSLLSQWGAGSPVRNMAGLILHVAISTSIVCGLLARSGPLSVRNPTAASASFWEYGSSFSALTLSYIVSELQVRCNIYMPYLLLWFLPFKCVLWLFSPSNHFAHSTQ